MSGWTRTCPQDCAGPGQDFLELGVGGHVKEVSLGHKLQRWTWGLHVLTQGVQP